jgi:hypothetical protein
MTKFKEFYLGLSTHERRELAKRMDTSEQYLYQLSTGFRRFGYKTLERVESATWGYITPNDLIVTTPPPRVRTPLLRKKVSELMRSGNP